MLFRSVVILLTMVAILVLNNLYVRSDYWRSIDRIFRYEDIPDNIDLAIFGSSHGECTFGYEPIQEKTLFNFAGASQVPYYDYQYNEEIW